MDSDTIREPGSLEAARLRLLDALGAARSARRGVPASLEAEVRAYAAAQRKAGVDVARLIVQVKLHVRLTMGDDEPLFTPRVVGWTVAGYYAGTQGLSR